jgi:hypothetical protein
MGRRAHAPLPASTTLGVAQAVAVRRLPVLPWAASCANAVLVGCAVAPAPTTRQSDSDGGVDRLKSRTQSASKPSLPPVGQWSRHRHQLGNGVCSWLCTATGFLCDPLAMVRICGPTISHPYTERAGHPATGSRRPVFNCAVLAVQHDLKPRGRHLRTSDATMCVVPEARDSFRVLQA